MPTFKTSDGPDQATLETAISTTLEGSDDVRRVALGLMEQLAQAKLGSLQRQRKRIAGLHGEQSDEVVLLDTQIAAHTDALALTRADAQRARAGSAAPPVTADTAIVQGRLTGADLAGIAGLVVAAVDATGKSYGRATTDANGYFRLSLPARTPTPAVEGRIAVGGAASNPALQLVVSKGDRELARSATSSFSGGTAHYVEIALSS